MALAPRILLSIVCLLVFELGGVGAASIPAARQGGAVRGSLPSGLAPAKVASLDQLPIAADAVTGIFRAEVAHERPTGTHTSLLRRAKCGRFVLYPEVRGQEDGDVSVVYFTAVDRSTRRAELIVGPADLTELQRLVCASST